MKTDEQFAHLPKSTLEDPPSHSSPLSPNHYRGHLTQRSLPHEYCTMRAFAFLATIYAATVGTTSGKDIFLYV